MTPAALEPAHVERFRDCLDRGGVAVFPADTVYGVCCDPQNEEAVGRLYALKRRPPTRPAAVMFFTLESALESLADASEAERRAMRALLPGPVTLVLPNRGGQYLPACGPEPQALGVRVPALTDALAALAALDRAVMQSSANISGGADPCRLGDVPKEIRDGADLLLDGGELPGTPSTVLDLRAYEASGEWRLLRAGALAEDGIVLALDGA